MKIKYHAFVHKFFPKQENIFPFIRRNFLLIQGTRSNMYYLHER